jgi:flavin reductase (DIM6/NTAB) family NADH-FMN oxidoreductase RutF
MTFDAKATPTDREEFKEAASRFASGVTVVTTGDESAPHGATVSAFCSLSLDPPQVLVSLTNASYCLHLIRSTGRFSVNVLDETQLPLAKHFAAARQNGAQPPRGIVWATGAHGGPRFARALSVFDCRLAAMYESGDHTIVTGDVVAVDTPSGSALRPLLHFSRAFASMGERLF